MDGNAPYRDWTARDTFATIVLVLLALATITFLGIGL